MTRPRKDPADMRILIKSPNNGRPEIPTLTNISKQDSVILRAFKSMPQIQTHPLKDMPTETLTITMLKKIMALSGYVLQ